METHFAYRVEAFVDPVTHQKTYRDIATKTFNLVGVKSGKRRTLINDLIHNHGECLAKLPLKFDMIDANEINLDELTEFINGEF